MITVLTNLIPSKRVYFWQKVKSFCRPYLRKLDGKKPLTRPEYGGHFGVTRSLVEGLKRTEIIYNYNPSKKEELFDIVIVLSGLDTLNQAIELKKQNRIRHLFAGPNLVILPTDSPLLIGEPIIDKFVVNSPWIKLLYCKVMPSLNNKMIIWPAGVNENYWTPDATQKNTNDLIFYCKRPEENIYKMCLQIAKKLGFNIIEIIYGSYKIEDYKSLLSKSIGLIHFVEQESQGLSLLEAWSMNVPTFVWNPGYYHIQGINVCCSSAPYQGEMTGDFFINEIEFENCMRKFKDKAYNFSPRDWVLNNMTDVIAARNLIEQISKFV